MRSATVPASASLGEAAAAELATSWQKGQRLPAEHFLERHPELRASPEEAARLIYEEFCLRQEQGEKVSKDEWLRRFPRWAEELTLMLDCHHLVRAQLSTPAFPQVGEGLGDFLLTSELGRGRQSRVYLAKQPSLADRPVVLKVTPRRDHEFLSLARLRHTHIIPLHGMHEFPARDLRALCQPYLGGASLARLLELLRSIPVAERTGRHLVEALAQIRDKASSPLAQRGGPREMLARVSYVEAICWIGACLADGLHYAHERGLVHLDLKPSNILLAADGQPLLLDFHLALQPLPAGQPAPPEFGGTPEFMSPEQREACAAARFGRPIPEAVDARSDQYSLGRVLYVLLSGEAYEDDEPPSPLHGINPQVSVGLSDIVHKCLARSPRQRYSDAAALAADLRRHLAHQPLRGARNRSLRERWNKWRRRRPAAPLWLGLLLALVAAGGLLVNEIAGRHRDAQAALAECDSQLERGAFEEARQALTRGRALVIPLPGSGRLAGDLDAKLRAVQRARPARHLHGVVEQLRLLAGADFHSPEELKALDSHCRAAWAQQALVVKSDSETGTAQDRQAQADLLDLVLFWSSLRQRMADKSDAVEQVLSEAVEVLGPLPTLLRKRQRLQGVTPDPGSLEPRSWSEHLALGQAWMRAANWQAAAKQLRQAVDLRPQDFWANFHRGACEYRLQEYDEAARAFGIAIALAPDSAASYYNRGLAHFQRGDRAAALRDYDRALELMPSLGSARLNRGILHFQEGRYASARKDLQKAFGEGRDAQVHYNLALVDLARKDEASARDHLSQVLRSDPTHAEALRLLKRLRGK